MRYARKKTRNYKWTRMNTSKRIDELSIAGRASCDAALAPHRISLRHSARRQGLRPQSIRRGGQRGVQKGCPPGTRASRPHHVRHVLGHLRHRVRPVTAPWASSGLASAAHAERPAACLQRPADAPRPPARNKDAGGTPALPGGPALRAARHPSNFTLQTSPFPLHPSNFFLQTSNFRAAAAPSAHRGIEPIGMPLSPGPEAGCPESIDWGGSACGPADRGPVRSGRSETPTG